MDPQEEALIAAVRAEPGDDAPRLVYADWLEERGGAARLARADFIRLECRLARLPGDDPRRTQMSADAQALWAEYSEAWFGPPPEWLFGSPWDGVRHFRTRRGFLEEVEITPAEFARHAAELFRLHPLVRSVALTDVSGLGQFAACPEAANLVELDLSEPPTLLDTPRMRRLLQSPHLTGLRALHLTETYPPPAALQELARTQALPALAALHLDGNNFPAEAVRTLCAGRLLARLECLSLSDNPCGDAGAAALASYRHLRGLAELNLSGTGVTDGGAAALAGADLPGLRRLDLSLNPIGDEGVIALARSPLAGRLTVLYLEGCDIGPRGEEALRAAFGERVVL